MADVSPTAAVGSVLSGGAGLIDLAGGDGGVDGVERLIDEGAAGEKGEGGEREKSHGGLSRLRLGEWASESIPARVGWDKWGWVKHGASFW